MWYAIYDGVKSMKKILFLILLLLAIPISATAKEEPLFDYAKEMNKKVTEIDDKIAYVDMGYDNKDYTVSLSKQKMSTKDVDTSSDYYYIVLGIGLGAIVLSASKRFIDLGR